MNGAGPQRLPRGYIIGHHGADCQQGTINVPDASEAWNCRIAAPTRRGGGCAQITSSAGHLTDRLSIHTLVEW